MIRGLAVFLLVLLTLNGCTPTIVREANVYRAEMTWYTQAAVEQARYLEWSLPQHCTCTERKFDDPQCEKAAKTALTAKTRAPWHTAMALFNAGMVAERPSETPPEIPVAETLCPGGR